MGLARISLAVLAAATLLAAEPSAAKLARRARAMAARNDFASAWMLAEQALARDPGNRTLRSLASAYERRGLQALRGYQALKPAGAGELPEDRDVANALPSDPVTPAEARELASALTLEPARSRHDFDLKLPPRQLIEQVCRAYGIVVVFDAEYPENEPARRLKLDRADWTDAMYGLALVTSSFYVPVSPRLAMFAKETVVKRAEIEPAIAVMIPFPDTMSAQELQDVANAVRMAYGLTKVSLDSNQRAMVLRDRLSRVGPAMTLAQQLMRAPAEVYVEATVYATDASNDLTRGLNLQTETSLVPLASNTLGLNFNAPALPTTYTHYASLGGGGTSVAMGIADQQFVAKMTRATSMEVTRASLRSLNAQAANLHIGDRYPVMQQSWMAPASSGSTATTIAPSVSFEDLGIVMKVTPFVHDASELTLTIELEGKSLTGETENGIPVISNRKFATTVRMRFGEAMVIAGLGQETVSRSDSGLPGLHWIPWLHSRTDSGDRQAILVVLRPELTRLPPGELPSRTVWDGTEVRPMPLDYYQRAASALR